MARHKILFDLLPTQGYEGDRRSGPISYSSAVFFALCGYLTGDAVLESCCNSKLSTDEAIVNKCNEKQIKINYYDNLGELNALIKQNKYDVFYSPLGGFVELDIPKETKYIYTIQDLRPLDFYDPLYVAKYQKLSLTGMIKYRLLYLFTLLFPDFSFKIREKRLAERNRKYFELKDNMELVTISYNSMYTINYFYPDVMPEKIHIFYSPIKPGREITCAEDDVLHKYNLKNQKYILLICGDRPEKGAYRAVKALSKLFNSNDYPALNDVKIIVTGVVNFNAYKKAAKASDKFIFTGYISAGELEILYKNAYLFVFPTLSEGFGYPPLEAMKYGTICACSANTSITEIYGDSVFYFNPLNANEICIRVLESFDKELRAEKLLKIQQRYEYISKRQEKDLQGLISLILGNDTM